MNPTAIEGHLKFVLIEWMIIIAINVGLDPGSSSRPPFSPCRHHGARHHRHVRPLVALVAATRPLQPWSPPLIAINFTVTRGD